MQMDGVVTGGRGDSAGCQNGASAPDSPGMEVALETTFSFSFLKHGEAEFVSLSFVS